MHEDDIVWVEVWATCLTVGCGNYGAPIKLLMPEGGDIACGPCGNPVTDITTILPEQVKELPAWILEKLQTQNSQN